MFVLENFLVSHKINNIDYKIFINNFGKLWIEFIFYC